MIATLTVLLFGAWITGALLQHDFATDGFLSVHS